MKKTSKKRQQAAEQDFNRMLVYLKNLESTWCYAVYDEVTTRDTLIERLRQQLQPIPVLERSLAGLGTDNALEVLRGIPVQPPAPAPIICLTGLSNAIYQGVLAQSLDLQRELFAAMPHRLVFWLRDAEWRELLDKAPNFSSRTNGSFDFQVQDTPRSTYQPMPMLTSDPARLEQQKQVRQKLESLNTRLQFLDEAVNPNHLELGQTLMELGRLYKELDGYHWAKTEGLYTRAERHFAAINNQEMQADTLFEAGRAAHFGGLPTALNHLEQALKLFREVGDRQGEANTLQEIGDVQRLKNENDSALENYQDALELFRLIGNRLGEANTLLAIGNVQRFKNENYQDALELFRLIGNHLGEANTLLAIGNVQRFKNENDLALENYQDALALFGVVKSRLGEANTLRAIGDVRRFKNENDLALENYQNALALYKAFGDRLGEANTLLSIGDVQRFKNENDLALENYQNALVLFRAIGNRLGEANTLSTLAQLEVVASLSQAKVFLKEAWDLFLMIGDNYSAARESGNFGLCLNQLNHFAEAKPYLQKAANLFDEIGMSEQAQKLRRATKDSETEPTL